MNNRYGIKKNISFPDNDLYFKFSLFSMLFKINKREQTFNKEYFFLLFKRRLIYKRLS